MNSASKTFAARASDAETLQVEGTLDRGKLLAARVRTYVPSSAARIWEPDKTRLVPRSFILLSNVERRKHRRHRAVQTAAQRACKARTSARWKASVANESRNVCGRLVFRRVFLDFSENEDQVEKGRLEIGHGQNVVKHERVARQSWSRCHMGLRRQQQTPAERSSTDYVQSPRVQMLAVVLVRAEVRQRIPLVWVIGRVPPSSASTLVS